MKTKKKGSKPNSFDSAVEHVDIPKLRVARSVVTVLVAAGGQPWLTRRVQQTITWRDRVLAAAAIYLLYFGCYGFVNRALPLASCSDWTSQLDERIPLMTWFVYPFYLAYAVVLLPAVLVQRPDALREAVKAFSLLVVFSCVLFWLIPTVVPRPHLEPRTIADSLVLAIYRSDRPSCGFPSLHVSAVLLSTLQVGRSRRRDGWLLFPVFISVAASTLLIKQHVLLDVLGGIVLSLVVHVGVGRSRPRACCHGR